jgi:hypothetical protein
MNRYPRTLNEAFPKTMENGASIIKFYHKANTLEITMTVVSIVGFVVILLDLFFWRA